MARYSFPTLQLSPNGRVGRHFSIFLLLSLILGIFAGMGVVVLGQPTLILLAVIGLAIFVGAVVSTEFGLLILVFLAYTRLSDIAVHRFDAPSVAKLFIPLLMGAILARWSGATSYWLGRGGSPSCRLSGAPSSCGRRRRIAGSNTPAAGCRARSRGCAVRWRW